MPPLGRAIQRADPRHLQLEVLVLVVIMCDVNDARSFLDALLQSKVAPGEVQLLQFRLGDLAALASSGTVIPLCVG